MSEKVKAIPIADTGILAELDEEERTALEAGMSLIIEKIAMRKSRKYGTYAVFDGENLEGEEMHYFTMSSVLTSQAEALLELATGGRPAQRGSSGAEQDQVGRVAAGRDSPEPAY